MLSATLSSIYGQFWLQKTRWRRPKCRLEASEHQYTNQCYVHYLWIYTVFIQSVVPKQICSIFSWITFTVWNFKLMLKNTTELVLHEGADYSKEKKRKQIHFFFIHQKICVDVFLLLFLCVCRAPWQTACAATSCASVGDMKATVALLEIRGQRWHTHTHICFIFELTVQLQYVSTAARTCTAITVVFIIELFSALT